MTNALPLAQQLQRRCDHSHKHQQLAGGRCADAAFYPLGLVRAIIKGIHLTSKQQNVGVQNLPASARHASAMEGIACALDKLPEVEVSGLKVSSVTRTSGGKIKVTWDDANFKAIYKDEYTQDPLPQKLIKEAIIEELSYFNEHVWEAVTQEEMRRYKDWKLVRSK